jgi:Tol biopolymer transport system component
MREDGTGLRFLRGTRGGSNPVLSPDGRKIAFARTRISKGLFGATPWMARVDGSGAHRLVELRDGVKYIPSSFSPDGSALAVTRTSSASNKPNALLLDLDGSGERRPLARFPASDPVFSPDGSQIALVRHSFLRRGRIESTHKDLYLVSASGTEVKPLTRTRWIAETSPSWDPSGERVVFNSFRINRNPFEAIFEGILPSGNSIVQVNADGSCREKLISLPGVGIHGVKWQPGQGREAGRIECGLESAVPRVPDGPRLALVKFDLPGFRFELETIDARGARRLPLAGGGEWRRPLPEWFTGPTWSPDGSKIVFAGMARRLDGNPRGTRLYVSQADGKGLRPLRGTHGAYQPVFAPDGHTIAFERYRFQSRSDRQGKVRFTPRGSSIWFVDLYGGAPRRITPIRRGLYLRPASFSPGGDTLLTTREVDRRQPEAIALTLSTGVTRRVVRNAFDPIYSPDGSKVAFVRWRSLERGNGDDVTTTDLFTVRADGGGLRRLTSGRKDDLFQSWDPSGERLAFVSYRPEVTDRDEIGAGSAVMQVNADGSCLRTVLKPSRVTALYGVAWQPGPGREAGRIAC